MVGSGEVSLRQMIWARGAACEGRGRTRAENLDEDVLDATVHRIKTSCWSSSPSACAAEGEDMRTSPSRVGGTTPVSSVACGVKQRNSRRLCVSQTDDVEDEASKAEVRRVMNCNDQC